MAETPTLTQRVQALPPEIFNKILDFTFTPDSTIYVDKEYRPPATLQVSQAAREKVLKQFFTDGRIFYVSRPVLPMWLQSIRVHTNQRTHGYTRSQMRSHESTPGNLRGTPIQCEIRITKLLFRTNSRTIHQLLRSLERAWDDIIASERPGRGLKKDGEFRARAAGRRWWRNEDGQWRFTKAVKNGLKFEVEYERFGKRAKVAMCDIEADLENPRSWCRSGSMSATEWCESKFGKY